MRTCPGRQNKLVQLSSSMYIYVATNRPTTRCQPPTHTHTYVRNKILCLCLFYFHYNLRSLMVAMMLLLLLLKYMKFVFVCVYVCSVFDYGKMYICRLSCSRAWNDIAFQAAYYCQSTSVVTFFFHAMFIFIFRARVQFNAPRLYFHIHSWGQLYSSRVYAPENVLIIIVRAKNMYLSYWQYWKNL